MTLKRIAAPATEPVTLDEAKLHLRVTQATEDTVIARLITEAREEVEFQTGRALVTQTWEQVLDAFPTVELELGRPPVQTIVSVKYIDPLGVQQTLAPSSYTLDDTTVPGWLLPAFGVTWPDTQDAANTVRVQFIAGYGSATEVPAKLKAYMLARLGTLYRYREDVQAGSVNALPGYADRILDAFRVYA